MATAEESPFVGVDSAASARWRAAPDTAAACEDSTAAAAATRCRLDMMNATMPASTMRPRMIHGHALPLESSAVVSAGVATVVWVVACVVGVVDGTVVAGAEVVGGV